LPWIGIPDAVSWDNMSVFNKLLHCTQQAIAPVIEQRVVYALSPRPISILHGQLPKN
jgi:hypothetical protein